MSDFGALLTVTNKDNAEISKSELKDFSKSLEKIIISQDYTNALGDPFAHEFVLDDDKESATVQLSEHYYGDDATENEELLEFVIDTETNQIEEIIEKLRNEFPEYEFSYVIEDW